MATLMKGYSLTVYSVEKAVLWVCSLLFSIMIVSVFTEIIMRSFFHYSLVWSAELATYCFMWITFLGSTVGVLRMSHLSADMIYKWVPDGSITAKVLELLQLALILIIGILFIVYGWKFSQSGMSRLSYAFGIQTGYNMLFIPVCGVLYVLNTLYLIISKLTGWEKNYD